MAKFRMDPDKKRYFCTLCLTGNIAQAAEKLHLSRQALSKSMRTLEKELQAQLFIRGRRGVKLTPAGRVLLRYLREEDRLWDTCRADIRKASKTMPERIRIGLLSMYVGYDQKRAFLSSFKEDSPIEVDVIDGDHDAFWNAIAQREMDFAFTIRPPADFELPAIKLCDDTLSVLLGEDNPLARKKLIDFKIDLRGKTIIQTSPYKGRLYEKTFRDHGIRQEALLHDKNLMLARVSTSEDLFIIQTQYAKALVTDHVCIRPLVNAPIEMDSMFVFHPDLSQTARTVAKKLLSPYGKELELESLLSRG